ncbi:MAG: 50S ribosomal protein L25/general stress protein Ctc, partial [Alphaproteobacteria bacterium]|nr:50S ribosomal protein L25/general stress protein Ctc [Alphaproteobacteria bacterium]
MTQVVILAAEMRDRVGKGTARAIRRENKVPAVIYGDKKAPVQISMDLNLLQRYAHKTGFFTHLFDLEIAGKKHRVLPRDVQFDPISDRPLHVDFLRVSASTLVRVAIPVVFINMEKSPGIKRGGTLNVVHHELEVACAPDAIPEKFEVSLEGTQINDAIHLSSIQLPKGVKLTTTEKDFTIASIAVPSAIRSEAADAAAAAATATPEAAATMNAAVARSPNVPTGVEKTVPAGTRSRDTGR